MSEIKCIAIDDEPLALEQIARFIRQLPELRLVGACLTVEQAQQLMLTEPVDLFFLDIEMPSINGVEFAKIVADRFNKASIIFTTAYPQYAVEGFRVDAVDYLLKPLSFEDLQGAVEKVKRRMAAQQASGKDIFVRAGGTTRRLNTDDIVFIKGMSEYVQICVKGDSKLITTYDSIKHLENVLPGDKFLRVHKSFLINVSYLESADSENLTVGGQQIPIGQKYRANFKQYLKSL